MRIICPHAGPIATPTRAALNASGRSWEPIDVSSADTAYTRLLATLWALQQPFIVVEHDIVIRPGVLDELAACPRPWCSFPYAYQGGQHCGLGCTKFGAELLLAYPHAVAQTWTEQTEAHPRGHWCNLDDRLARVLTRAGAVRHVHGPAVTHLNPSPTHGCA